MSTNRQGTESTQAAYTHGYSPEVMRLLSSRTAETQTHVLPQLFFLAWGRKPLAMDAASDKERCSP
jgi:hypothetical protein